MKLETERRLYRTLRTGRTRLSWHGKTSLRLNTTFQSYTWSRLQADTQKAVARRQHKHNNHQQLARQVGHEKMGEGEKKESEKGETEREERRKEGRKGWSKRSPSKGK